jgi:hypothetical protein
MSTEHESSQFHHITDVRDIPVELDIKELLFIDDHCTLLVSNRDYEHMTTLVPRLPAMGIPVDIGFIQTIGTALLKAFNEPGRDVTVLLSQADLMSIREISATPISYGTANVGLSLKRKLYAALFGADVELKETFDSLLQGIDLDFGDSDEPTVGLD